MAEGSDTYNGLAVPLFGDFEIKQRTAATDIVSITGASGQAGDFIVCQDNSGTEVFVVSSAGSLDLQGVTMTTGTLDLSGGGELILEFEQFTTAPTTGLTTGQLYIFTAANVAQIGVASAAGATWRVALTNN